MVYAAMLMSSPVEPGEILAGKYKVERVLGVGGMGVVVAAQHVQLEEHVAIKFMLPEALKIPDAVARFLREAKAAARLKSEHVAKVSDVGTLESGSPYMVMEYLEGRDLGQLLQDGGAVPPTEAVDYMLQACEALAEAHSVGIVHRDLKPANLFLANRPGGVAVIKVLDFGISKITSPGGKDVRVTGTTTMVGSPTYMSPEQLKSSRDVDARSDVWALGVTLYELVSGSVPYESDSMPMLCAKILTESPRHVRYANPHLSPELGEVIMKCLLHDLDARWSSVAELANALAPFGTDRGAHWAERASMLLDGSPSLRAPRPGSAPMLARPGSLADDRTPPPPAAPPPGSPGRTATTFQSTGSASARSSKGLVIGAGAAVAIAGVAVAAFLFGSRGRDSAAPTRDGAPQVSAAPPPTTPPSAVAPAPDAVASVLVAPAAPSASAAPAASSSAKAKTKPRSGVPSGGGEDDLYGARR